MLTEPTHVELAPPVNLYETDDELVIELEAPGLTGPEIGVDVVEGVLLVHADPHEPPHEERVYRLHERRPRAFRRSFHLPPAAGLAALRTHARDGVFEIRIPKGRHTPKHLDLFHPDASAV